MLIAALATVVEGIADAAAFAEAVIGEAQTHEIPGGGLSVEVSGRLEERAF